VKLQLVGCSHHGSSLALRERLAFNPTQLDDVLWQLRQRFPSTEIVVLSTCNRVEVYTAAEEPTLGPSHQDVSTFLAEFHCRIRSDDTT
jgi:glutamyl-tRNA reductase